MDVNNILDASMDIDASTSTGQRRSRATVKTEDNIEDMVMLDAKERVKRLRIEAAEHEKTVKKLESISGRYKKSKKLEEEKYSKRNEKIKNKYREDKAKLKVKKYADLDSAHLAYLEGMDQLEEKKEGELRKIINFRQM